MTKLNTRLNKRVYEVRINTGGNLFFADENDEQCDGSQNYWIDSKSVAKSVFKKMQKAMVILKKLN